MAKSSNNRRSPRNTGSILMGLAAVLFCLVAVSTHMTGNLYARYVTQGQGSDAVFALDMTKIHLFDKETELNLLYKE